MITELTPEQEAQLDVYRDKWIDIGLATGEVNVPEALKAAEAAYKAAGLEMPEKYEVYASPFEAISEMKLRYDLDITTNDFAFGSHDATWLAFHNYFLEVLNIEECGELKGLMDLAEHCGWWLPFDELVVFTHRPLHIKFDEEKRTHCENDFAIKYRDGTGVTIWHGIRVPEEWIFDKDTITSDVMLHWSNIEERRAACEIIGWAKVLEQLNATVINKDDDEIVGTLLEAELPDVGVERFLLARDPNVDKMVGILVPKEMQTALEANSWTYGIDPLEFKPEFRV